MMNKVIIKIYDFLRDHRKLSLLSFLVLTTLMFIGILQLNFKEDIADFLPLDQQNQEAMSIYQDVSGADKILGIFQYRDTLNADPDKMVRAIEDFTAIVEEKDTAGLVKNLAAEFDLSKMTEVSDFAYSHIPYFLESSDYARIDSLLASPGYVHQRLEEDKQLLMFPSSGMLSGNLQKDPLNLFSPVVAKLGNNQGGAIELYDGHIFTPDMSRALVMMESPFGNSETKENSKLTAFLQQCADSIHSLHPDIAMHFIGGPTIAVGNAERIKQDSVLSIAIALVLIVALLVIVFRKPLNILLIVVSVAWGWLFAMAMLSIVHNSVSLIVIGISSIILGIAVNYPLHLIAHIAHAQSMRQVLKEIIAPLVIGNITTVGAFLALVPLKAAALRDLGIFSAFILVGTILFVVIYLPHIASFKKSTDFKSVKVLDWLSNISLENHRWLTICVLVLTIVFAFYSTKTKFDANMSHINYMTAEQKEDMEYFNKFSSGESVGYQNLYVVSASSTIDDALHKNFLIQDTLKNIVKNYDEITISGCSKFLPSSREQQRRLQQWHNFLATHREALTSTLKNEASSLGFSQDAFEDFNNILDADYPVLDFSGFNPLSQINEGYLSLNQETDIYRVITVLKVPDDKLLEVKEKINLSIGDGYAFDVKSMNEAMANGLSDNFNYIGWACGLIVFFFLWFSFASIELAILSFLPMAVSWIWIMGIMGLFDIQFNIVNIILATFIFGQGDDYTIFITEGCCYEYAYRKKMLASFKRSIIISALIMFIGIGTLIFAKHPALHSLAQITIIGMFSVVLMAWLLPPVVFNWLTRKHGKYRTRPLTLASLLRALLAKTGIILHRGISDRLIPGFKILIRNNENLPFAKQCMMVYNHQSLLDQWLLRRFNKDIVFIELEDSGSISEQKIKKIENALSRGYKIALGCKGLTENNSSDFTNMESMLKIAAKYNFDIVPVTLYGADILMPDDSLALYAGQIIIQVGEIISAKKLSSNTIVSEARSLAEMMKNTYRSLAREFGTVEFYLPFVFDRYRYKGTDILNEVKRRLKKRIGFDEIASVSGQDTVNIKDCGYGETAILFALVHPEIKIIAYESDSDMLEVAKYAAAGIADNIEFRHAIEPELLSQEKILCLTDL